MYDVNEQIIGYELLFRGSALASSATKSTAYATSQVIVNAFTEFGVQDLVGDRLCFVNLTRDFLVGTLPIPVAPERAVLEVLETVVVDDDVIAGVTALAAQGHRIALDDFVWGAGHEQLLDVASYVKLDFLGADEDNLRRLAESCRRHPRVRLVAERLETPAALAFARQLGCEYFQGYVLGRPQVVTARALSPSRLRYVELMVALSHPDVTITEIVSIVTLDPGLSFRLLRASNAVDAGLWRRISSVHESVVLLGISRVREWVSLMLLSDVVEADESQLAAVITRARLCQLIAQRIGAPSESAFTAGMLAGVAELLEEPVEDLVGRLPLVSELATALTRRAGILGVVLDVVEAYELGDVQAIRHCPVPSDELARQFLAATGWTTRAVSRLIRDARVEAA